MVLNAIGLFRKQIDSHICFRYDLISYKLFIMRPFHASFTHKDIKNSYVGLFSRYESMVSTADTFH